jgi:hypothetical protein
VAPNVVPFTVTAVPVIAVFGVIPVMPGDTEKVVALLASPATVTTTGPVVELVGTVA